MNNNGNKKLSREAVDNAPENEGVVSVSGNPGANGNPKTASGSIETAASGNMGKNLSDNPASRNAETNLNANPTSGNMETNRDDNPNTAADNNPESADGKQGCDCCGDKGDSEDIPDTFSDDVPPKSSGEPHINITAKLFLTLFAATLVFSGLVVLSVEFLLPFYRHNKKDVIATPEQLWEIIEEEYRILKEQDPDASAEELMRTVREKYQDQIAAPYFYGAISSFMRLMLVAIVAVFIVTLFFYARSFTRPLRRLNKAAREIANLNFDSKITLDRYDEIGQLGESLNIMSDRLHDALEELKEKNEQLEKELEHERELDNVRKKFVSDVSHELKTPLAIIGGYAEALKMGVNDEKKRHKYSRIIMEEIDKMNTLVRDLLVLSRYQTGEYILRKETFDFKNFLAGILDKYDDIFERNGISVVSDAESAVVNADPSRMEQVVTNFLNNAVSHISEEKIIAIQARKDDDVLRFRIMNSGGHIDEEDIENIWTPFYRTDKARGRDEGRFGIGLSIVKALLERHDAEFGVLNASNVALEGGRVIKEGVEFWFELPLGSGTEEVSQDAQE